MSITKEGLYLHCYECGHFTPLDDESRTEKELRARFDAGRLQPCERCDSEGSEDPYCYELVKVSACPGTGDVVEDCDAEDHHYGLGQHVTTIEG